MKLRSILPLCLFFLLCGTAKADVIITYKSGTVVVFKGNVNCGKVIKLPQGATCRDGVVVLGNNGSWRNWIKKHYTPYSSYFRIKRGRIKVVDQEKTLFYRKWFFGKKHIIGKLTD